MALSVRLLLTANCLLLTNHVAFSRDTAPPLKDFALYLTHHSGRTPTLRLRYGGSDPMCFLGTCHNPPTVDTLQRYSYLDLSTQQV